MLQYCDVAICVVIIHRLYHVSLFALGLPLFLTYKSNRKLRIPEIL